MESGDIDHAELLDMSAVLSEHTPRERELSFLPIDSESIINGGNNESMYVSLKDDGAGVFKPVTGEKSCMNCERGTLYKRERAGYLVDKYINLGLVPSTVVRNIDGRDGSFQEFISNANAFKEVFRTTDVLPEVLDEQAYAMWIFDQIIWNIDRNGLNALVKDDKLFAIDHGYAFAYGNLATLFDFTNDFAPRHVVEAMRSFHEDPNRQNILFEKLAELLPEEEVEACQARITTITNELLANGKIENEVEYGPGLYV